MRSSDGGFVLYSAVMKLKCCLVALLVSFGVVARGSTGAPPPQSNSAADARVGVYDSRIVSFAHFWSEPNRQERDALIAAAKAAKAAGSDSRFKELSDQLEAMQARSHLQVFSTAPADDAMAALKERLPEIQRELGISRLVSKWDEASLVGVPEKNRIEVTERLVREFNPDEKRRKTIEAMKHSQPIPLDRARELLEKGKL